MGNPAFAIPTLKAIMQSNHELVAVVSNPPKQIGRGRSLSYTPVGKFSKENAISLIEPQNLFSEELKSELNILKPDIFIVVAYKILPDSIIAIPKYGALNLHASLLPKYRGAGPIQWALMNGDKKSGVTIFQIKPKVDTGDILMQKEVDIFNEDNMLSLGNRLCEHGANMMIEVLNTIEKDTPHLLLRAVFGRKSLSHLKNINKKKYLIIIKDAIDIARKYNQDVVDTAVELLLNMEEEKVVVEEEEVVVVERRDA